MLKAVLWRQKSRWQIIGASIGVFIGLLLLLFALQVYADTQVLIKGARDSNFLVLNKLVKSPSDRGFSAEEIDTLQQQSFFNDLGVFESNRYEVYGKLSQLGFETYLFFQSIPTHFLDCDTSEFVWNHPKDKIPVILSNDYLTLYNFGFGASQGFPKINSDVITGYDFDVILRGKGKTKVFKGNIIGFTHNVNSILVPASFMQYANSTFGREEAQAPNQVIVSTDNPYNKQLELFLDQHDYEISRGGLIGGELKSALYLLLLLVLLIAAIIIALSLLVFVLNFQLLIEQSSQDICQLLQLGYPCRSISQELSSRLIRLFLGIAAAVFLCLYPIKYLLSQQLIVQGYPVSNWVNPWVLLAGIAFCGLFVWINQRVIRKSVVRLA